MVESIFDVLDAEIEEIEQYNKEAATLSEALPDVVIEPVTAAYSRDVVARGRKALSTLGKIAREAQTAATKAAQKAE